jgi:hypothetical protein
VNTDISSRSLLEARDEFDNIAAYDGGVGPVALERGRGRDELLDVVDELANGSRSLPGQKSTQSS